MGQKLKCNNLSYKAENLIWSYSNYIMASWPGEDIDKTVGSAFMKKK